MDTIVKKYTPKKENIKKLMIYLTKVKEVKNGK